MGSVSRQWGAGGLLRKMITGFVAIIAVAATLVTAQPAQPAVALDGSTFNAGYIISDQQFYAANAMTEAEIQAFLDAKIGTCTNGQCLNVLTTYVASRAKYVSVTGNTVCEAFQGGTLRASTIIYRVQVACGISAKVILVTLQKEQSLVTSRGPAEVQLAWAMGMACPDTAECNPTYRGFGNQVYEGSWQLKIYKVGQGSFKRPGVQPIAFHPNSGCGSSSVNVQNYATAALYNYTPYQPNAAALANLGGVGDACSSYGNRNFWVFYSNWFGNPTGITPTAVTDVDRIAGADRYETAVRLSASAFTPATNVVYITQGANFPDALSAAPAAIVQGAPLLLVTKDTIPPAVSAELTRLSPTSIVVVGDSNAISDEVVAELGTFAPVRRDGGPDRFGTSRAIVSAAFTSAATAYIATGVDFPDALAAGAAAGFQGAPVILVNGGAPALDEPTAALLASLGVTRIVVVGGLPSVNAQIEANLRALPGVTEVTRLDGRDRFATASLLNRAAFDTSDRVYLAYAYNFPDALAGATVAGAKGAPLYLAMQSCVQRSVVEGIIDVGATKVTLLGQTLDRSVEQFANCD